MKKILTGVLIIFMSCNNNTEERNISTVDSNTAVPADSNNAILYLDNPQSDSFSIAIDSGSATPADDAASQK